MEMDEQLVEFKKHFEATRLRLAALSSSSSPPLASPLPPTNDRVAPSSPSSPSTPISSSSTSSTSSASSASNGFGMGREGTFRRSIHKEGVGIINTVLVVTKNSTIVPQISRSHLRGFHTRQVYGGGDSGRGGGGDSRQINVIVAASSIIGLAIITMRFIAATIHSITNNGSTARSGIATGTSHTIVKGIKTARGRSDSV
mmetsp:Transcript_2832/g.4461  ORF Transcript_2832/g.4461 Transcript_2832/m.4461 type:complete len:200 (-) Transcript_2832:659-1258(-)